MASTIDLNLSLAGDVQLNRTLIGTSTRVLDMRPAWQSIVDQFLAFEARQFATEGAAGSGGWAPLADATIEARLARGGQAGPVLDDTGALKNSLTVKGAANQVLELTPDRMSVGTLDPKATFHQQGTSRMQARKPIDLPESTRKDFAKTAQRWWVRGEVL